MWSLILSQYIWLPLTNIPCLSLTKHKLKCTLYNALLSKDWFACKEGSTTYLWIQFWPFIFFRQYTPMLLYVAKGPFKYYVIKKVGGWVWQNAYVCLQGGWVGVAKCLRNFKNPWKMVFLEKTKLTLWRKDARVYSFLVLGTYDKYVVHFSLLN